MVGHASSYNPRLFIVYLISRGGATNLMNVGQGVNLSCTTGSRATKVSLSSTLLGGQGYNHGAFRLVKHFLQRTYRKRLP